MFQEKQDEGSFAGGVAPVDLAHLNGQTLGDERLRREVLALFLDQITTAEAELEQVKEPARRLLAHSLVGAARAIGAFALAEGAAELEAEPHSDAAVARLLCLIEEARGFIAAHMRAARTS